MKTATTSAGWSPEHFEKMAELAGFKANFAGKLLKDNRFLKSISGAQPGGGMNRSVWLQACAWKRGWLDANRRLTARR